MNNPACVFACKMYYRSAYDEAYDREYRYYFVHGDSYHVGYQDGHADLYEENMRAARYDDKNMYKVSYNSKNHNKKAYDKGYHDAYGENIHVIELGEKQQIFGNFRNIEKNVSIFLLQRMLIQKMSIKYQRLLKLGTSACF
jgi:hypothetical protein